MIEIQGIHYNVIDVYNDSIALPDCFAVKSNKYGKGHGEAKLYIGTKIQMNNFFSKDTKCFVLKEDFYKYLSSLNNAKSVLSTIYKNSVSGNSNFAKILNSISNIVQKMEPQENFELRLMNNLKGPRGYINSKIKNANGYYCLRACCIPIASFIRILKLEEVKTKQKCFYIKLFPDFREMYQQIQHIKNYGKKNTLGHVLSRSGQSKYKKDLLQLFKECPFTKIQDERLLVASHIRPFALCEKSQQYDTDNGLLLSPLYDKLLDRGFITFAQDGRLRKSIWLSPTEWSKIPLDYAIQNLNLTSGRKAYLRFHEDYVFLGD